MVSSMNHVCLAGKLAQDVEMRFTPQGKAVAQFSVAINETWEKDGQKKESTVYVDCTAWEGMAEKVGPMRKGNSVVVVGKLRKDSWEDKKTQEKRWKMYVLAEAVTNPFGSGKKKEASPQAAQKPPTPPPVDDDVPF